jgi:hypothetical protein
LARKDYHLTSLPSLPFFFPPLSVKDMDIEETIDLSACPPS